MISSFSFCCVIMRWLGYDCNSCSTLSGHSIRFSFRILIICYHEEKDWWTSKVDNKRSVLIMLALSFSLDLHQHVHSDHVAFCLQTRFATESNDDGLRMVQWGDEAFVSNQFRLHFIIKLIVDWARESENCVVDKVAEENWFVGFNAHQVLINRSRNLWFNASNGSFFPHKIAKKWRVKSSSSRASCQFTANTWKGQWRREEMWGRNWN